MKDNENEIKSKQPYEKPKLRTIELAAEEVMGVGCKTVTSPGPITFCNLGTCFTVGS